MSAVKISRRQLLAAAGVTGAAAATGALRAGSRLGHGRAEQLPGELWAAEYT